MSDITIALNVSPAEAALAGVDHCGERRVVVRPSELSPAAREVLAELVGFTGGICTHRALSGNVTVPSVPIDDADVPAWLERIAAAQRAAAQRTADEREQRITAALAAPAEAWVGPRGYRCKPVVYADGPSGIYLSGDMLADPRIVDRVAAIRRVELAAAVATWQADVDAAQAADEARKAQAKRESEAQAQAQAAAAARRADQLATWLAVSAPEALRKRAARGLLPEDDLVGAIRDEAYRALNDLPRFVRLTDDEVRRECDADEDDAAVEYAKRDAESAADQDIALMELIEARVPGAQCTLVEHVGWLAGAGEDDDPEASRFAVRVRLQIGELQFSREYATP